MEKQHIGMGLKSFRQGMQAFVDALVRVLRAQPNVDLRLNSNVLDVRTSLRGGGDLFFARSTCLLCAHVLARDVFARGLALPLCGGAPRCAPGNESLQRRSKGAPKTLCIRYTEQGGKLVHCTEGHDGVIVAAPAKCLGALFRDPAVSAGGGLSSRAPAAHAESNVVAPGLCADNYWTI